MRRYDVRPVDPTVHIVTVLTVALILGTQLYGPDELHGDCRQVPKKTRACPMAWEHFGSSSSNLSSECRWVAIQVIHKVQGIKLFRNPNRLCIYCVRVSGLEPLNPQILNHRGTRCFSVAKPGTEWLATAPGPVRRMIQRPLLPVFTG